MLTLGEVASALGKKVDSSWENICFESVTTDSRRAHEKSLFVAIRGENADGNKFVLSALKNGAPFAVAEYLPEGCPPNRVLIVENSKSALLKIAGAYRRKFKIPLVGVTGSVGKTTTREFIYTVLGSKFTTLENEENLNNEIGVSHTLLTLNDTYEAAVIEMGMDGLGQIEEISAAAYPQIAVITNIGVSHLEKLKTRENILKAKTEILSSMDRGSALVLCGDNDLLSKYENKDFNIVTYGIGNKESTVRAENAAATNNGVSFNIISPWGSRTAFIPIAGEHNVLNALAAFTVGSLMGLDADTIVEALKNYVPVGLRQKFIQKGKITFVADCYNSAPDSLNAAVKTLASLPCEGRKIMVVSDMLELGEDTCKLHENCGRFMEECKIDGVLGVGELTESLVKGAENLKIAKLFQSKEEMAEFIKGFSADGDIFWFKASHGMKMEEVLEKLL